MTSAVLRSAQTGAILTTLGLSVGLMTGVADAEPPSSITSEHACLSPVFPAGQNVPAEWTDLNKRYGVSERIVGPPPSVSPLPQTPGCLEAFAGEKLVRAVPPWIMAPDKVAQFTNSFKSARYVIDEGTAQQRTITVGPNVLQSGKVPLLKGYPPGFNLWGGSSWAVPVSPVFGPLSVTKKCDPKILLIDCHTATLYVTMSNDTGESVCNGLENNGQKVNAPGLRTVSGQDPGCLPAGLKPAVVETSWPIATPTAFTVKTPSRG